MSTTPTPWCTDLTYVPTAEGLLYLVTIEDPTRKPAQAAAAGP